MLISPIMAGRESISRQRPVAPGRLPPWRPVRPGYRLKCIGPADALESTTLSNAGVIVGDDLLAIDALGLPVHAKAFIAAAKRATGKPFGRLVKTRGYSIC